jgi:predicted lipoprotein with Yx(FWY)xxD motif
MTGKKATTPLATAAMFVAMTFAALSCGGGTDATGSPDPPRTEEGRPATVGVKSDKVLGRIIDDAHGRTLYLFEKDTGTNSTCAAACASVWPPLRADGRPVPGTGATAALGAAKRSDGIPQVTYNGHPLYTYTGDRTAGDTNGQGLTAFGGAWFALSPAGIGVSGRGSAAGDGGYQSHR